MANADIHGYKERVNYQLEQIEEIEAEEQKQLILDYADYLASQDLSDGRIRRYLQTIRYLLPHIDFDLSNPSKQDLIQLVGKINTGEIKEMSDETKKEYKKGVRKWMHFLADTQDQDIDVDEITDFFSLTVKNHSLVDPDNLLGPEQVKEVVQAADRTRDKALCMTLWSTGGRASEILGLQWSDVKF